MSIILVTNYGEPFSLDSSAIGKPMPIITQIVCDRCQAVKRKANHWYALTTNEEEATLQPLDCADWETVPGFEQQYLCGRSCAVEALTQWMDQLHSPDESKIKALAECRRQ
jgi:hypothetical protein